jgi:hypothetical protein
VGGINAVATHPDHRRLGLGTLTLQDCHVRMRAAGLQVGLLGTGITNWYRKLGWERAGQQRTFTFDRRNVTYLPEAANLEISEDWPAHVEELCTLRAASGVGATRTPATFALLAARKASRIFLGWRRGRVVAYTALSGASVREYAGAAEDVAALLRLLFPVVESLPARSTDRVGAQQGQFELSVLTPVMPGAPGPEGAETDLPALLLDLGIPSALGYMGMLAILDAAGLFAALDLPASVEPRGDGWRVRRGDKTLDLTEGDLVKLVFGPERRPDFAPDVFPVPFYQWPMDRV